MLILACAAACAQPTLLTCPPDEAPCADGCVDLATSNENCGVCGHACEAGTTCGAGECVPAQTGACAIDNGGCSPDADCIDMAGTALCACKPGFTGDGLTCAACTACDATQFAAAPCTPVMDAVCVACAPACETGLYEAQPCGPFADRVCTTCTSCGFDEYETQPCAPFGDRQCATCTLCGAGQYAAAPCMFDVDTVCEPCGFGCAACAGPGASCTACEFGFVLDQGLCLSACGNGVIDPGEACDDANPVGGDGCAGCMVEAGSYCFGGPGPSLCRAGTCQVEPGTALPLGAGFELDGAGTASAAGLHLTQRSLIRTTADVIYPILVEADVTYTGPDITFLGARGIGLRDSGNNDEPTSSLRARLSASAVELVASESVLDSIPTPFSPQSGVRYHVRYFDDGSTVTVEWIDPNNPQDGVVLTAGSTFHGAADRAFVGGGDMGGVTIANVRVCEAPALPVTAGLIARYSAIPSWTVLQDVSGNVTRWQDTSGGGHDLDVDGPNPGYSGGLVNGHGGLDFTGGARLTSQPFALTTDVTVFAVMVNNVPDPWGAIAHHGDRDLDWSLEQSFDSGSTHTLHWQTSNDNAAMNLTLVQGVPHVLAGRFAGTARYFSATPLDGLPPDEVSIVDAAHSITAGSKALYVGTSDAGEASNAFIGDLVYYDRALSDLERDQVIAYLRGLWRP